MNENHPFFSPDNPAGNPGQTPEWMDIPRRADLPGDFQTPSVKSRLPVAQAVFRESGDRPQFSFTAVTPNFNHPVR